MFHITHLKPNCKYLPSILLHFLSAMFVIVGGIFLLFKKIFFSVLFPSSSSFYIMFFSTIYFPAILLFLEPGYFRKQDNFSFKLSPLHLKILRVPDALRKLRRFPITKSTL